MKKLFLGVVVFSSFAFAGVSGIHQSGYSASGKPMYKVQCSNGRVYRIYKSGGEWYEGSLGAVGGNYRSLSEQARVMCR